MLLTIYIRCGFVCLESYKGIHLMNSTLYEFVKITS
jgi:hypothetical protein